jgi:hypothetical protein
MFEKNDRGVRLAMSMSPENDRRIEGNDMAAEAERLHRLAMSPEQTIRAAAGVPRRRM